MVEALFTESQRSRETIESIKFSRGYEIDVAFAELLTKSLWYPRYYQIGTVSALPLNRRWLRGATYGIARVPA